MMMETAMHKIGSMLLLSMHLCLVGSAVEQGHVPSLQDLALNRITHILKQWGTTYAMIHPSRIEAISSKINPVTKDRIVDTLLKPYETDIMRCKELSFKSKICSVHWNGNSTQLAVGGHDEKIYIWDAKSGQLNSMEGANGLIYAVQWNKNGSLLASGDTDGSVCIWDVQEGRMIHRLDARQGLIYAVDWHPREAILAASSADGTVCIWDVHTEQLLKRLQHKGFVVSVHWHPDGTLLASGSLNGAMNIWDAKAGRLRNSVLRETPVSSLQWHSNGTILAIGSKNKVFIFNIKANQIVKELEKPQGLILSVDWNPAGNYCLGAGYFNGSISVWDVCTGHMTHLLKGHRASVHSVHWSANGNLLASGGWDNKVCIWNGKTYEELVDALSIMQALYFTYRMEHNEREDVVLELSSIDDCHKSMGNLMRLCGLHEPETDRSLNNDTSYGQMCIDQTGILDKQSYLHVVEASLPDVLKNIIAKKDNES